MVKKLWSTSFLSFSVAKAVVFLVPLLILWSEGQEYYVMTEQVIAIALLSWPLVAFGMTAVYPYFILEKKHLPFKYHFYKHLLVSLSIVLIVYLLSIHVFNLGIKVSTALFLVFLMVFSYFFSITYKCKNDVKTSSFFDALPYALLFLFVVVGSLSPFFAELLLFFIIVFLIYLVVNKFKKQKKECSQGKKKKNLGLYYKKSFYSFLVSWIAIVVVMFPRTYIPEILSNEESQSLYLSLRFAAILVLGYQFLQISFYSDLYKISYVAFLKLWWLFWALGLILYIAIMLFMKSQLIVWAAFYTFLWISVSFLELQVVRKSAQKKVLFWGALLFPLVLIFLFIDNFTEFALVSAALLLVYISIQLTSVFDFRIASKLIALPLLFFVLFGVAYV